MVSKPLASNKICAAGTEQLTRLPMSMGIDVCCVVHTSTPQTKDQKPE